MKQSKREELFLHVEEMLSEISRFQSLIDEGKRGHHLLFTPEMLKMELTDSHEILNELLEDQIDDINRVINESFDYESIEEKQDFFASQPHKLRKALVYGYFQLLDGQMSEAEKTAH